MDIPLQTVWANGNGEGVSAANGDEVGCKSPPAEDDQLLSVEIDGCNGETAPRNHIAESQTNERNGHTPRESRTLRRVKEELEKVIFWKVKLWMVVSIVAIFLLIVAVILLSLGLCAAFPKDTDEDFDPSLFVVPLHFKGSFQLPNLVFTEKLLTASSNESQALAAVFKEKLTDLYRSSPALGRYFSGAEIYAFRNGSVIADYKLTFLMPEEQQHQLTGFTLSREVVYNLFRQYLYDQEQVESDLMYVDPSSLNMFSSDASSE